VLARQIAEFFRPLCHFGTLGDPSGDPPNGSLELRMPKDAFFIKSHIVKKLFSGGKHFEVF
jgi:hypothetical protein